MAWLGFRICLCRMQDVNSISVNLAVIMFSIYYFSEVEEFNRVIEKQLRKEGTASRW